jgi:hypothetical protein
MGGIVSLVTKSGSNALRGSGFEFFRDSALDARDFFDRGADPTPFHRNQFGASAGGPIRKDRLFFFGGVERLQEDLGTTTTSYVPSDAARRRLRRRYRATVRISICFGERWHWRGTTAPRVFVQTQPTRESSTGQVDYT